MCRTTAKVWLFELLFCCCFVCEVLTKGTKSDCIFKFFLYDFDWFKVRGVGKRNETKTKKKMETFLLSHSFLKKYQNLQLVITVKKKSPSSVFIILHKSAVSVSSRAFAKELKSMWVSPVTSSHSQTLLCPLLREEKSPDFRVSVGTEYVWSLLQCFLVFDTVRMYQRRSEAQGSCRLSFSVNGVKKREREKLGKSEVLVTS